MAVRDCVVRQAGAVVLQRVAGRLLDHGVGRQAQVVVRAQGDPLAALHLHHRPGLAVDLAEVGQQVELAGRVELLQPLVERAFSNRSVWVAMG